MKLLMFLFLLVAGCGTLDYLEQAGRRAVDKREDGTVPVVEIAKGASELVTAPTNLNAWAQVGEALVYILFGAGGIGGILAARRKLAQIREEVPLGRAEYERLLQNGQKTGK